MKVRILSGNHAGTVEEMQQTAAEVAICTGYAEAVTEPAAAEKPGLPSAADLDQVAEEEAIKAANAGEPAAEEPKPGIIGRIKKAVSTKS